MTIVFIGSNHLLTDWKVPFVESLYFVSVLVASSPWGYLADTFGRR